MDDLLVIIFVLWVIYVIGLVLEMLTSFTYKFPGSRNRRWYTITWWEIIISILGFPITVPILIVLLIVYQVRKENGFLKSQPFQRTDKKSQRIKRI